ncbi:MAG TPA: hypothetical protein VFQ61_32220 [Polyangiaceae bacterium]|nr:hypothetical protein [Polyangiaceae bacterium]
MALRLWPRLNRSPIPSEHWFGNYLAEVRASPGAERSYANLVTDTLFPDGTWLIESLREARSGRSGPILVLARSDGEWSYWIASRSGGLAPPRQVEACKGCHDAAPAAPVFGLPPALLGARE